MYTQQSEFLANYQSKKMLVKASKTKIIEGRKSFIFVEEDADTVIFDQARRYYAECATQLL